MSHHRVLLSYAILNLFICQPGSLNYYRDVVRPVTSLSRLMLPYNRRAANTATERKENFQRFGKQISGPSGCASLRCCVQGGGDCNGYNSEPSEDYSVRPEPLIRPLLPFRSRNYFVPRRARTAINRRNRWQRILRLRKVWGPDGTCNCEYDYELGGCRIHIGAPEGQTCHCRYLGLWTCDGVGGRCGDGETCPAGCTSFTCCIQGGGDCNGYPSQPSASP